MYKIESSFLRGMRIQIYNFMIHPINGMINNEQSSTPTHLDSIFKPEWRLAIYFSLKISSSSSSSSRKLDSHGNTRKEGEGDTKHRVRPRVDFCNDRAAWQQARSVDKWRGLITASRRADRRKTEWNISQNVNRTPLRGLNRPPPKNTATFFFLSPPFSRTGDSLRLIVAVSAVNS